MNEITFCGIDINSITNLNQLILNVGSIHNLVWKKQNVNYADTTRKATKNNLLVWDQYNDGENRLSIIKLKSDQGKTYIIKFSQEIIDIQLESSKDFNFKKCSFYEIYFGIAVEFDTFFKSQLNRINSVAKSINPEAEFKIKLKSDRIFLFLDKPLIASLNEELSIRSCIDRAKYEADQIVNDFKARHFFGSPFNKWEMYVYFNSESVAKINFNEYEIFNSLPNNPKEITIEVKQNGLLICITIYQHYESAIVDCAKVLKSLYFLYFKDETAKIFDQKNTIKPFVLPSK